VRTAESTHDNEAIVHAENRRDAVRPTSSNLAAIDAFLDTFGDEVDETDEWVEELEEHNVARTQWAEDDEPEPQLRTAGRDSGGVDLTTTSRVRQDLERQHPDIPPAQVAAGYRVDKRGALRRDCDGAVVPGAVPVTLERCWKFTRTQTAVLVPDLATAHPELAWAQQFPLVESVQLSVVWVAAREVPNSQWESRCRTPYDYVAPELAANRLLSISDIASLVGVTRQTISTYAARGLFPEAQYRVGGSPVWSAPVVHHWFATRPGQGRQAETGTERQISTTG
jgi:hypothetical protein